MFSGAETIKKLCSENTNIFKSESSIGARNGDLNLYPRQ
jgi:hypothetical protein